LVAGRKRVPRPATGRTAFLSGFSITHSPIAGLVCHGTLWVVTGSA